jgi:hypothetical protein
VYNNDAINLTENRLEWLRAIGKTNGDEGKNNIADR